MLKELIYLGCGIEKKITHKLASLVEEGKKEYEDKDIVDIGIEHLKKRKNQVDKLFSNEMKEFADELGLATKQDIEELKNLLKK